MTQTLRNGRQTKQCRLWASVVDELGRRRKAAGMPGISTMAQAMLNLWDEADDEAKHRAIAELYTVDGEQQQAGD